MSLAELQSRLDATLPDGYIEAVGVPGYQAINLALINEDFPIGPLPRAVMNAVIKDPAYWAFCWGSGIALALLLLSDSIQGICTLGAARFDSAGGNRFRTKTK